MSEATGTSTLWSAQYRAATFAILTVVALSAFDGLAITAAFPSITEDLGDVSLGPWIFTGYLAASAISVTVGGPIIDGVGVRRTFRITSIWFLVASAACAAAPTMLVLVAARVAQGAAGGVLTAVSLAAVGLTYPGRLHARAFAANSIVWGGMGFGGPALGALFLEVGGWRLVFLVQLPLTALAMATGWSTLPSTRERPRRLVYDRRGIGLLTVTVIILLMALDQVGDRWLVAAAGFVATACAAWAYIHHARAAADPVLSLEHLTRVPIRWIHLVVVIVFAAGLAAVNYLPLYMQIVRGWSVGPAAFSALFLTVGWTLGSTVVSRLLDHHSPSVIIVVAAALHAPSIAIGAWMIATATPIALVFVDFLAIGMTIGAISTTSLSMLQAISSDYELGRVNSAHQFLRSVAITFGVALGSAILFAVVGSQLGDVEVIRDALEGDAVSASGDAIDAVRDGFAWVLAASAVLGSSALAAARALRRSHRDPVV